MGANTSVYEPNGQLKPYPYPYSLAHKVWQFPWKFHFANSKTFRLVGYGVGVGGVLFFKFQTLLRSKENREMWREKRSHYAHTYFDPPEPPHFKM